MLYLESCCLWIRNRDHRKLEGRVIDTFETWRWRRMLKIKWSNRIMNYEVSQRVKEERFCLEI
jgi:hypothetical protein